MTTPLISPLPTPPSRADNPALFNERSDAFLAAQPQFVTQANAQAVHTTAQAASAGAAAVSAQASAAAAAADRAQAAASSTSAQQSAASAQGFALQAGLATNVPVLIFQPRRLTTSLAIPSDQNAHTIGPFEVDASVTVQGLGNSTWTGM